MKLFRTGFSYLAVAVLGATLSASLALADDAAASAASAPTKHQLMKDCMRKEKAAISGRENYDLAAECRDITKTEKQNADAGKEAEKKPDAKEADKGG